MSGTSNLVFLFVAMGVVAAGMIFIASSMFEEPVVAVSSENVNTTTDLIADTGALSSGFLVPSLILIAALVAISAIYLVTKKR